MSRNRLVLAPVPAEQEHCPVPGLLVSDCWSGPGGSWWAGALLDPSARVVQAPAGRLTLSGPATLAHAHDRFLIRFRGELGVEGIVAGQDVHGVVDQPGTSGWLRNLTAVSRERKQVRLRLSDGRTWWLRATGPSGLTVSSPDGRAVARRGGGAAVELDRDADATASLAALLLLTGIDRDVLLVLGSVG
jgi:hypothetical protein